MALKVTTTSYNRIDVDNKVVTDCLLQKPSKTGSFCRRLQGRIHGDFCDRQPETKRTTN